MWFSSGTVVGGLLPAANIALSACKENVRIRQGIIASGDMNAVKQATIWMDRYGGVGVVNPLRQIKARGIDLRCDHSASKQRMFVSSNGGPTQRDGGRKRFAPQA
ncbi:hypothetical protein A9Z06_27390 [Rhizobium sp. YK2]|nr:hypothetical protein A9Z06_27390 [Rhizobium sp. YK2]